MKKYWWEETTTEPYWLEFTDREDLGADLRAPESDATGGDNWRYTLFKHARPGDVVFHYHKPQAAIVAVSRISGDWKQRPIVWGARGTFARHRGDKPHERPGYFVPLSDYRKLPVPLTLDDLREKKGTLKSMVQSLSEQHPSAPLYFPFEVADRPVRALQGYAFKLPSRFVAEFKLDELAERGNGDDLGTTHRNAQGQGFGSSGEVRRAVERYAMAVALRRYRVEGYRVQNVSRTHPYDVLAENEATLWTVEVKGTVCGPESVFLTRNEVAHARKHGLNAVLFVVHGVEVCRKGGKWVASGGKVLRLQPWAVEKGELEPLQFRYFLPSL